MNIKSFKVENLHGSYNFELKFKDNTLILVGENGSGKSTLMKMLFYVLSCQWKKLSQYMFSRITIDLGDAPKIIEKSYIDFSSKGNSLKGLPWEIYKIAQNSSFSIEELEYVCRKHMFSIDLVLQKLDAIASSKKELSQISTYIKNNTKGIHFLYLPTYRRIEMTMREIVSERMCEYDDFIEEIESIKKEDRYTELVGFGGMKDVQETIDAACKKLKNTFIDRQRQLSASNFKTLVEKSYDRTNYSHIFSMKKDEVRTILDRLDEEYLTNVEKDKLVGLLTDIKVKRRKSANNKQLCFYFDQFLKITKQTESDERLITTFSDVCQKYIMNKTAIYDKRKFTFGFNSNGKKLSLDKLSSGEKQVVSLFAHMYLDSSTKYYVLIDEPEMSLSIKWQQMFLKDIKDGDFCDGLFAVTHSPFVFEDSLDSYAHGMSEFKIKADNHE